MRPWLPRLYYALTSAVLVYFCAYYSFGLYVATQTRSIGFSIDTLYLEWNTTFPAVTVCEIYNSEKIWELSESFNGADRDPKLDDLLADVAFFNGNCNSCRHCDAAAHRTAPSAGADREYDVDDTFEFDEYEVEDDGDDVGGDNGAPEAFDFDELLNTKSNAEADDTSSDEDDVDNRRIRRYLVDSTEDGSEYEYDEDGINESNNGTKSQTSGPRRFPFSIDGSVYGGPASGIDDIIFNNDDKNLQDSVAGTDDGAAAVDEILATAAHGATNTESPKSVGVECPTNFTSIVLKYRTKCADMLFNCTWNGRPFECCRAFLPVATEFGECYTINSMHTIPPYGNRPLISNRQTGPGRLVFTALEDVNVHVHAPHDVPYTADGDIKETILYGSVKTIIVALIEMSNEPAVANIHRQRRRCRFPWEGRADDDGDADGRFYRYYSPSTCSVECASRAQMRLCNCTHHLMPMPRKGRERPDDKVCDLLGLLCLTENVLNLAEARRHCDCLPSCEEPEYNSIYASADRYREDAGSMVTISLVDLPKQRHKRTLARSNLDMIISVGGLCGLFFGLSLLSTIDVLVNIAKWLHKWTLLGWRKSRRWCLRKSQHN